jgi:hypothetical protein
MTCYVYLSVLRPVPRALSRQGQPCRTFRPLHPLCPLKKWGLWYVHVYPLAKELKSPTPTSAWLVHGQISLVVKFHLGDLVLNAVFQTLFVNHYYLSSTCAVPCIRTGFPIPTREGVQRGRFILGKPHNCISHHGPNKIPIPVGKHYLHGRAQDQSSQCQIRSSAIQPTDIHQSQRRESSTGHPRANHVPFWGLRCRRLYFPPR